MKIKAQEILDELVDESDEEDKESEDKKELDKDTVLDWFRENPGPSEKDVKDFAKELDVKEEELQEMICNLIADYIKMLDEVEDVSEEFSEVEDLEDFEEDMF